MYFVKTCTYCTKVFYTYHDRKEEAAKVLYDGIKKHLVEWGEDSKEHELDEAPELEIDQIYYEIIEAEDEPQSAYEL